MRDFAYSLCYVFHSDFLYGAVPFIVNQTFGLVQPLYSKSDHLRELVAFTKTCRIKDQSNKQTNYIGWGIVLVRVTIRFLKMLIPLTNVDHRRMAGKTYFPGRSGSEPARKLLMCHIKALNTDSLVFSCTSRIQIKWLFLKVWKLRHIKFTTYACKLPFRKPSGFVSFDGNGCNCSNVGCIS